MISERVVLTIACAGVVAAGGLTAWGPQWHARPHPPLFVAQITPIPLVPIPYSEIPRGLPCHPERRTAIRKTATPKGSTVATIEPSDRLLCGEDDHGWRKIWSSKVPTGGFVSTRDIMLVPPSPAARSANIESAVEAAEHGGSLSTAWRILPDLILAHAITQAQQAPPAPLQRARTVCVDGHPTSEAFAAIAVQAIEPFHVFTSTEAGVFVAFGRLGTELVALPGRWELSDLGACEIAAALSPQIRLGSVAPAALEDRLAAGLPLTLYSSGAL